MKKWSIIFAALFAAILVGFGIYTFFPGVAKAPVPQDETPVDTGNAAEKADLIRAATPTPNSTVTSPFVVSGEARGTWYFEASFPYNLIDAKGSVIAQGPAVAQGDWMTEDFVPFTASITFPPQLKGSKGTLILKKDNPSGDPANDDQLTIPVTF